MCALQVKFDVTKDPVCEQIGCAQSRWVEIAPKRPTLMICLGEQADWLRLKCHCCKNSEPKYISHT